LRRVLGGLVVHAIVGDDDDSLLVYEIVAGLFGVIFGAGLGAFYGGVTHLPRDL
jgi:hypothetical protein